MGKLILCGWCGWPAERKFDYTPHWLVDQTKTLIGWTCAAHDPYPQASRPFQQEVSTEEWLDLLTRKLPERAALVEHFRDMARKLGLCGS
jgi:hypothetical protein